MVMKFSFSINGWGGIPMLFVVFMIWSFLTLSILVMMEGMSAFLHALRLHWWEIISPQCHLNSVDFTSVLRTFFSLDIDYKNFEEKMRWKKSLAENALGWVCCRKQYQKKYPIFLEWWKLHEMFLIKFVTAQTQTLKGKVVRNTGCKIIKHSWLFAASSLTWSLDFFALFW